MKGLPNRIYVQVDSNAGGADEDLLAWRLCPTSRRGCIRRIASSRFTGRSLRRAIRSGIGGSLPMSEWVIGRQETR